jgi:hypothetical protein
MYVLVYVCVLLDIVQVATPLSRYAALCVDIVFVFGWCAAVSPFAIERVQQKDVHSDS